MSNKRKRGSGRTPGPPPEDDLGGARVPPGKRTKAQSLPAAGPSSNRIVATPAVGRFKPTEIGRTRHDTITLTNVSDEPVDFWNFLQTVLDADGKERPAGDFSVVGGETTGDELEPGGATNISVAFMPKATHPDDSKPRAQTRRATRFSIVDTDGAAAGTFQLEGRAIPSSADTLDKEEVGEVKSAARSSDRKLSPKPKTFAEMRHHLMAAGELLKTSERSDAEELVDDVNERMYEALRYDQVFQAFRSHGLGTQSATMMVAHARDLVEKASRGIPKGWPIDWSYLLDSFEVAKEPIQFTLGEITHAPTIRAMHDASPAILAAQGAVELGKTAKRIVTDAAFAGGFGLGVLEGAGGAIKDLATGVADVLEIAFDIARAMVTGGLIGTAVATADKVDDFFDKMPTMLVAMGTEFSNGWNKPDSFGCGNFRGEVIGYIAAQIALVVISGGAAAEGVAFASMSRWGKVVAIIQKLDNAGDIVSWASKAGRGLDVPRRVLDRLRDARKGHTVRLETPGSGPHAPDGSAAPAGKHHGAPSEGSATRGESPPTGDTGGKPHASRQSRGDNAWETGIEPGLPATPETIAHGTCQMELHPGYSSLVDDARARGFVVINDHKAHVANIRVIDPAGKVLEVRRELHVVPGMRYLDLEHELGHIHQLERFGNDPPATETLVRRADGTETAAKNELRRGTFNKAENNVVEYHNRLEEYVRLAERGAPDELLRREAEALKKWRVSAEGSGLGQGRGGGLHRWARDHFPEIPELERRARALGADIGLSNARWEESP